MTIDDIHIREIIPLLFVNFRVSGTLNRRFENERYILYTTVPKETATTSGTKLIRSTDVYLECLSEIKIFKIESKTKGTTYLGSEAKDFDGVLNCVLDNLEDIEDFYNFQRL